MARYEHLPIYKKTLDLTIYFEKIVRNFSRYHKYTLRSELGQEQGDRGIDHQGLFHEGGTGHV